MLSVSVIANLQSLRGVAAAMVVLHHMRDGFAPVLPGLMNIHVGAAGVDLFFVLSGVVITVSAPDARGSRTAFLLSRLLRVVPMYWLALFVLGILLLAGFRPLGIGAADATLANMIRSMGLIPFARADGTVMPLLGVGWTLWFEMIFYLMFAALIGLPGRTRTVAVPASLIALVAIGHLVRPDAVVGMIVTHPLVLEFAAGVVLGAMWKRSGGAGRYDLMAGIILILAGVAGLAASVHVDGFSHLYAGRVLAFGAPAVLCVSGALLLERGGWRTQARGYMLLGAVSYVLYLSHLFVLQVWVVVLASVWPEGAPLVVLVPSGVLVFVLCHLIAVALHLRIEAPLLARGRRVISVVMGKDVRGSGRLPSEPAPRAGTGRRVRWRAGAG